MLAEVSASLGEVVLRHLVDSPSSGQKGSASVRLERSQAQKLAIELRKLREAAGPNLTQAQLAKALSAEGRVAAATLSSWESVGDPKTPPNVRLKSYAHFFCTPRSWEGEPRLIPASELTVEEQQRRSQLESRLLHLANPVDQEARRSFQFEAGPVTVICSTLPEEMRDPLASASHVNFTKLRQYGDLDALMELWGHLRAENPEIEITHRLSHDVTRDDFSGHVVLLGGGSWNPATRHFQQAIGRVPITQLAVDELKNGEIFAVKTSEGTKSFYPDFQDLGNGKELVADIGFFARLRNPFKINCTLTICNGTYSRGVFGAVRLLTDTRVREENEEYLAKRFPDGQFAMLVRVPVVTNETVSPDLQNPTSRLFEWAPAGEGD